MYITILNKETNKYCIISNKYRGVINEAFNLLSNEDIELRTNHLYPFVEFLRYIKKSNLEINLINKITSIPLDRITVLFFQDISSEDLKLIKYLSKKNINPYKIISIAEHPVYQIKNFINYIKEFEIILCPYNIPIKYEKTIFAYIFESIPFLGNEIEEKASTDVSLICSNLSTRSKSNYAFRRHLINVISSIDTINFAWYGRGWKNKGLILNKKRLKYKLNSLIESPKINTISYKKYKGEIKNKTCLLNSKMVLAIENHSWPNGYVTEKFLEPLIYGSIPLYIGSPIYNLKDVYSDIHKIIINQPNTSKIIESIMHFKEMPVYECKKISGKIKDQINKIVSESKQETNLMRSVKIIMNKLT